MSLRTAHESIPPPKLISPVHFKGGVRYGVSRFDSVNYTWPFVRFEISPDELILEWKARLVWPAQRLIIPKASIKHLSKWREFFCPGLRIEHSMNEIPPWLVFWTFDFRNVTCALTVAGYTVST
jgi:hypothetical protein